MSSLYYSIPLRITAVNADTFMYFFFHLLNNIRYLLLNIYRSFTQLKYFRDHFKKTFSHCRLKLFNITL